jgi:replicative DNA helicase
MSGDLDPRVPQDLDAERALLGELLLGGVGALHEVADVLKPAHFYREAHAALYGAMLDVYSRGEPVDALTVAARLESVNKLDDIGGRLYVAELLESAASYANASAHARIVRERAAFRGLIEAGNEIIRFAQQGGEVDSVVDQAEQAVFKVAHERIAGEMKSAQAAVRDTFKYLEDVRSRGESIIGCPTGLSDLDRITSGFQDAELQVVAGRPGMGKTALMLRIALHAALVHNIPTAVFSLEMSWMQVAMRLLSMHSRINMHRVRTATLSKKEWPDLSIKMGELTEARMWIDDTPNATALQIRAKCRRLKAREGLGLVVVDYMQLMQGPSGSESRQVEISIISRELKALAKELQVPVIAGSQLSRKVEDRDQFKRPQLADLRESGAIEQDADVVLFVYRPVLYGRRSITVSDGVNTREISTDNYAELIIGKNRNGPTGSVHVSFVPDFTLFTDLDLTHAGEAPVSESATGGVPF